MIFVGTSHLDLIGPERLRKVFDKYKPKRICVESPDKADTNDLEDILNKTKNHNNELISRSNLPDNFKQLNFELQKSHKYEFWCTLEYVRNNGCEIYLVDHPKMLQFFSDMISPSMLETSARNMRESDKNLPYSLLKMGVVQKMDESYRRVEAAENIGKLMSKHTKEELNKKCSMILDSTFAEEREQYMTDRILEIKPDMHIGGMMHIFPGYICDIEPLYGRIEKKINYLSRIRLCEF